MTGQSPLKVFDVALKHIKHHCPSVQGQATSDAALIAACATFAYCSTINSLLGSTQTCRSGLKKLLLWLEESLCHRAASELFIRIAVLKCSILKNLLACRYFPTLLTVLLAVFNDGAMIALSKDRVTPSQLPNSWKLQNIFICGIVYGVYLSLSSWALW